MVIESKCDTDAKFTNITFIDNNTTITSDDNKTLEHIFYNPDTDRIEADRAIETTLNSLFLGEKHKMSSGGENIFFTNLSSNINWYPPWGGITDQKIEANRTQQGLIHPSGRVYQDFNPVPLGGTPVTGTSIPYYGNNSFPFNIQGVGITTQVAEVVPINIKLKYEFSMKGIAVYNQFLNHPDVLDPADPNSRLLTWYFDHPIDITGSDSNRGVNTVSITKFDENGLNLGYLLVCEGITPAIPLDEFGNEIGAVAIPRYQTTVLSRFFDDKDICFVDDLQILDIVGFHNIYVNPDYPDNDETGTVLKPFKTISDAVNSSSSGDNIFIKGDNIITSGITLPHSLKFYGLDGSKIRYASYSQNNETIFTVEGSVGSQNKFVFNSIDFRYSGNYAIKINLCESVDIIDCTFLFNGWNGVGLDTGSAESLPTYGYNSSKANLGTNKDTNMSEGGAIQLSNINAVQLIGNKILYNFGAIRLLSCCRYGNGFITRNIISKNIESGIYLNKFNPIPDSSFGCFNITVLMNYISFNAENGIFLCTGMNNKFSQNEINGNWNAGFCSWSAGNITLRDSGLYDNNRTEFTGSGNDGQAKGSIQINEGTDTFTGNEYRLDQKGGNFIIEILDTQIHYTGVGSTSSKIGIYIDQQVGDLSDNDKNIIKIDDVGFIGQDYAIDLSNVDLSNIRLSLGDNSYQSIGVMAVTTPLNNSKYSELPFSNHVMAVPILDVLVDVLNHSISLLDGIGGNIINVYSINELESVLVNTNYVNIIQTNTYKIQLRGLTHGNVYVNGVVAGTDINTMNNTLNEAFRMSLINYKSFLVSEIGLNPGNIFPTQVDSWKIAYGDRKDEVITDNSVVSSISDQQPFYNGNTLEKGHEFTWTHDNTGEYTIGIWSGAEEEVSRSGGNTLSNWSVSFLFRKNNGAQGITDNVASEGIKNTNIGGSVAIDLKSRHTIGYYNITNNTKFALRYGMDNYLYLLDITNNTEVIIARSNSILIGNSQIIYFSGDNSPDAVFPVIQERTNIWSVVHKFDTSENDEWIDGVEEDSIIKSNMEINPGEMVKIYLTYYGRSERIGINYTGASSGNNNAQNDIVSHFIYRNNESIEPITDWTPNTSSSNWDSGNNYWNHVNNAGVISLRYNTDNSLVLFSDEKNEIIATKTVPLDGTAFSVYIGFNESQPYERIPKIKKLLIENVEYGDNLITWYYIESPDGNFQYPLFKREEEAKLVDTIETGSGTSSTISFIDDISGTTWYKPDTNFVNNGTVKPPRGAWGGSTDIIWNEQKTLDDSNYAPTFSNIVHTTQENTGINIEFNTEGNTYTYEFNNGLPIGYSLNTTTPPTRLLGTTEIIEFSVPIQHVIDVTKSNSFGSVTGQIIINVLPNITSNEFTVISIPADNNLKLTQDNGVTELSMSNEANSPIFKAGETNKFYFDHSSVVSTDEFDFFLLSDIQIQVYGGGATAYGTGVTTNGTFGEVGSYVQIELDDDVPPLFLRWKATGAITNLINMSIEDSTFEDNQLAKTVIGPVSNINGTQVTDKIYVELNVKLLPGQRLIIPKEFLKSATTVMESSTNDPELNTPLHIGIKNTTLFNENDPFFDSSSNPITYLNNFVGDQVLSKFIRQNSVSIENNMVDGLIDISSESFSNLEYGMFIEIPIEGDTVRMGVWAEPESGNDLNGNLVDGGGYDINNTPFIDWPGNNKNVFQTNIIPNTVIPLFTGAPVVFRFDVQNNSSAGFDLNNLDWDSIYKVGSPLGSKNFRTTNWSKGVVFNSSNNRLVLNNTNNLSHVLSPTLTSTVDFVPLNPDDITKTSKPSNINSKPWACSLVFKPSTQLNNQYIWNEGSGSASDSTNIYLRIENKVLYFGWGKHIYPSTTISGLTTFTNEYNECKIYTLSDLEMTEWWGIYIGFRGARFKATADTNVTSEQASPQNLSDAFDIRITSNSLGWDTLSQCSILANWTNGSSGFSMLNNPTPLLTVGSRNNDRTFEGGTIASMVITTLLGDSIMPSESEIKLMIIDPIKWTNKHKYGHAFRQNNSSNVANNIVWKDNSNTTQVWLMGDLITYDSFSLGISTYKSQLNTSRLLFTNMLASNLISINIPGL